MPALIPKIIAWWDTFWFRRESTEALGIFRILLGLFIFLVLAISFPNWERFYGPGGSLPLSALSEPFRRYTSLFVLTDQVWFTWIVFWFGLLAAITFTLGFKTRIATVALFFLSISMLHRNPSLINGQDQIATMLLLFSCFAPLGNSLSADAWLHRLRHRDALKQYQEPEPKPIWSLRLMQLSIAAIYIFSAPAKYLNDTTWRDGSAIYYVTLSDRWFRFTELTFFQNEIISTILTYVVLIIQLAFPLLVWFQRTRLWVLAGIAMLHFSMLFLMAPSVFFFNLIMLIAFILFIPPKAGRYLVELITKLWGQVRLRFAIVK